VHLGEKQHWRKSTLWEEATHVPLVIVAPGLVEPGGVTTRPVSLVDLYPTLIDLAGLPDPVQALDGSSLRPLLEDPQAEWSRPALTVWQSGNHSLRFERWRYTRYRDGSEELYDHQNDPMEWKNLADDPNLAELKQQLRSQLPAAP
jgi:arylsulfatase A-like enzyme